MTTIRLHAHPFNAEPPLVFADELSLGEWLLRHYGERPAVRVQVFAGEPSAETEVTSVADILESASPEYVVLESPGEGYTVFQIIQIVIVVFSVAAALLASKPSALPGNVNRTQESPNNSLGSRENQVRILQRVEDIYGTVLSVPSLMMPTYNKYKNNLLFEYGYYCVGRGYYDINDVKDGDTLLSDISGSSAAFYKPFTSPNSGDAPFIQIGDEITDDVVTVRRSVEINGLTLSAPNQSSTVYGANYYFSNAGVDTRIQQQDPSPNFNSFINIGDQVTVSVHYPGDDPDYTPYNLEGTFTATVVGDGFINVNAIGDNDPPARAIGASIGKVGTSNITDWVTMPDPDRTQVWANFIAQGGMYKDDGSGKTPATVNFYMEIERLDPVTLVPSGQVETVPGVLSGATTDERAVTVEYTTTWAGPARVRAARTTDYDYGFSGTIIDEVKWTDLYSVSPVSKTEFGNKTTVQTITEATPRATSVKSRQLNMIATRLLPIYDGNTFSGIFDFQGRLAGGTISGTSRLSDIIAAVSVDPKIGGRNLATDVDMPQIYATQQLLDAWNPACGQFNYTLDSDNISYEETLILVANAGFCVAYRQNGKVRLSLDRAQATSTALFTHRNKRPQAETITRTFANDSDYDGVEFVYADPDTLVSETINLPLDGGAKNAKKFEIAGIRSFTQAWLRANREYYKIRGQRIAIETETTNDARALLPNSRVDIVDNTRFKSYDGEIVAQSGLTVTLSRAVAFTPSASHSLVLMRRDGSLQAINVTPGPSARQVVLATLPAEAIETVGGAAGIRTIFSFASDAAHAAQAYLVQEIDLSGDTYPVVRAVNYSDSYYQADYATIPDKSTIIS